ncbi:hypothetical protein [Thiohalomonas denitrificans]|uniref:hypothetical protein n=1 Tax=Thiohalomonas denitrificans TaxID=415747 RepID=UPI0026EB7430|nr:hypothetical protein [Thiohalomonas denitrificans]
MNLHGSYFSIEGWNPLTAMERVLNPYRHIRKVPLRGGELTIRWTSRAERALRSRTDPLAVEMQLYFACVVKKRTLFPAAAPPDALRVDDRFLVYLTTVESDRCDPIAFAADYPARRELVSTGAKRMRARELLLDYRKDRWSGDFFV